jgi:subtilisin family serine protease
VNFRRWLPGTGIVLGLWLCAAVSTFAQTKVIRLRNEQITTAPPDRSQVFRAAQANAPASGLFLIQFTEKFNPAWREELLARKVELVRYVPDDAFVARLTDVNLEDLRALPYVQWAGEFRPEHKVHGGLRNALQAVNAPSAGVTVLFSPSATPAEILEARLRLEGVKQESKHRFGTVLRGWLAPGQLQRLAQSPAVLWIEPAPRMKLNDEISSKIVGGEGTGHATFTQELGFDGRGYPELGVPPITVAVADTGLHIGLSGGMHPDLAGRTPVFLYYGDLMDASDEHGHGTHVAGIIAGNGALGTTDELGFLYGLGVASGAAIVTQRIFDGDGQYTFTGPFDTFDKLTSDALHAGAVIGNNSWGDDTQGRYDVSAAEFDALVRDADTLTDGDQPYILEFSAGNAGPFTQTIGSPAVAKNVIATGASESDRVDFGAYAEGSETMADFSSRGPCEDGRIKPDVVAPGTWIASLQSPLAGDVNGWPLEIDSDYLYMGGTSQAGPHVAGAAAVFVQYYRDSYGIGIPSPALVKAALIHSAVDMDDSFGTGPVPNMDEGWGRVDLTEIIRSSRAVEYLDQTVLLKARQTYERSVIVASTNEPLKITLVYTDVPGFPAAIPALVNDLDLETVGPDGRVYRGNQFEHGESVPDARGSDNINNVEGIYIPAPLVGEYIVRVRATNVVLDARIDTIDTDQDFALVISGDTRPVDPLPEAGVVLLDRGRYTAPSQIKIKLFDLDLAGVPSVNVTVRSQSQPNGQTVVLRPLNPSGVFTGSIATVTAPAAGKLQIAHGNWIRAEYFDASEHVTNVANAVADLVPPVISAVAVTNQFNQMVVSWTTDEPATSIVRFGTNATLNRAVTNTLFTTSHEIELSGLIAGQTYYYAVISADAAGNVATNSGGGTFNFVAVPASMVLLVDAYIWSGNEVEIPSSAYTNALNQTGVSYDVWSTEARGFPVFNNLRSYQIVMWRLNDSFYSADTIPTAQQNAIQQYLNSGGAFFMASMDILTRLLDNGGASFVTNVLHVQRFGRNPDPLSYCQGPDCDEDFQVPVARGVANDLIGDGIFASLDYSSYPVFDFGFDVLGPDFADTFGVATNATAFLLEDVSGKACGMRFPRTGQDSTGRVVFVSFPLDVIPESGSEPNNRSAFLRRAFQFLAPGLNGLGTIALDQDSYHLPDLVTIEVADSDLAGLPSATVQVYSTTAPNPINVTLRETARSGLFRGFIPLVSPMNASSNRWLRATNGDTIHAEYYDASGQSVITSLATVDTVLAVISAVTVDPEYQDATISWDTSEPADALVQFGESAFLGRTAYVANLGTSHEVRLSGLVPDRLYYYKVVSRDAAGNTTEYDTNGQPYTFRTLRPLTPPFVDNLQNGGTNWQVFNGEDSQFYWRVGSPQNNHVANTPSGDGSAWASNLLGDPADYIDTFLISPAIDLTGGNVARLNFWSAYDFGEDGSEIANGGELLIFTNSVSDPATLWQNTLTRNSGWEMEEIDLTPYLGNVIFLVWHHQLFSISLDAPIARPGWAIDDVSVTVSNIPPCTICVSNNLAQGRVSISGPANRAGQGYVNCFTNLPPGRYVVTWLSMPYYQAPASQTNVVAADDVLTLSGNYTFPDANRNGMSDTWEQQYFGVVATNRTCTTDTDGDGFPDCAEFAAGTNPTNTVSYLRLYPPVVQPNNKLLFQWTSVAGHIYQVQGYSFELQEWRPLHDGWIRATAAITSKSVSAPEPGEPYIFHVEARP